MKQTVKVFPAFGSNPMNRETFLSLNFYRLWYVMCNDFSKTICVYPISNVWPLLSACRCVCLLINCTVHWPAPILQQLLLRIRPTDSTLLDSTVVNGSE